MINKQRIFIGALTASLTFIGGIKGYEGFTSKPVIPTKGDVPTIGHGTTVYPNGKKVTLKDKPITRETAHYYLANHVNAIDAELKKSLGNVKLTQNEFEAYLDFAYQYGVPTFNKSSMHRLLKNGQYTKACNAMLRYHYVSGRDCSIRKNNCYGVWTRQQERVKKCLSS